MSFSQRDFFVLSSSITLWVSTRDFHMWPVWQPSAFITIPSSSLCASLSFMLLRLSKRQQEDLELDRYLWFWCFQLARCLWGLRTFYFWNQSMFTSTKRSRSSQSQCVYQYHQQPKCHQPKHHYHSFETDQNFIFSRSRSVLSSLSKLYTKRGDRVYASLES